MPILKLYSLIILVCLLVSSCDNPGGITSPDNTESALQRELSNYTINRLIPDIDAVNSQRDKALEKLGMELFFSKSLSGNFDVACASCHHPLLAGGDKLSLPVGEAAYRAELLGPGRWHDWQQSEDPKADGAPNVARHSPTTFNSVLYQQALFADGRVFVDSQGHNNKLQPVYRSPDSRFAQVDTAAGTSLLATQTRFPVTSNEEMRGYSFAQGKTNDDVRQAIVQRLNGQNFELSHNKWLQLFRLAFKQPTATQTDLITFENIQNALAAYQRSQLLINNNWYKYVKGDKSALSEKQKQGALLFFKPAEEGGAGCVACHQPPTFTDEKYHNIAMIQFGRGKRANQQDFGRRGVSQREEDRYGFRTPSLLNIEHTAPYGHTGAYVDLKNIILHHIDPDKAIHNYNFSFNENPQLRYTASVYNNARQLTRKSLEKLKIAQQEKLSLLAEGIQVNDDELSNLIEFLTALTDPCLESTSCLQQWIPDSNEESPDIMRLVAEFSEPSLSAAPPPKALKFKTVTMQQNTISGPKSGKIIPSIEKQCNTDIKLNHHKLVAESAPQHFQFSNVTNSSGIHASHSIAPDIYNIKNMQRLNFSGGAAAGDINGDCFNDIYYVTGSESIDALYINNADGTFTDKAEAWNIQQRELTNGASFVDIDGDGDLDLFTSNMSHPKLDPITPSTKNRALIATTSYQNDQQKTFSLWPEMSLTATVATWSYAFADYDSDGDLDVLSSHWQLSPPNTQHLWRNEEGVTLTAVDRQARLKNIRGSKDLTFTGIFSDANNDGYPDILMTADFEDSQVFINQGNASFNKKTQLSQISDENGMGAAVIDVDNDGDLDWFVSSIWDPRKTPPEDRNWGLSGNRLYQNNVGIFSDISEQAGIQKGYWGWGSCFADFNNDGWPDIFHANGFGFSAKVKQYLLNHANNSGLLRDQKKFNDAPIITDQLFSNIGPFNHTVSRLYISNQHGNFTDQALNWGITDNEQGRAVICFDYDRDGDVDIFVSNNSGAPILYNNNARSLKDTNFINIRLKGLNKNTQAVGAKVYVTANGITQLQEVRAGGSFLSGSPAELHFGLADATEIDHIEIIWPRPDCIKHRIGHVAANQFITIIQPDE